MQSKHLYQTILIRTMLIAGLPRAAIVHHLGISQRQIEHVANTMRDNEGFVHTAWRKPIRKSGNIIKSRVASFEASIVMSTYSRLAGEQHKDSIDLDSLIHAYRLYGDFRKDLDLCPEQKLHIADVWCLTRDLIQEEAMLIACPQCSTMAYVSIDQTIHSWCPVCPVKEQSLKYLAT